MRSYPDAPIEQRLAAMRSTRTRATTVASTFMTAITKVAKMALWLEATPGEGAEDAGHSK